MKRWQCSWAAVAVAVSMVAVMLHGMSAAGAAVLPFHLSLPVPPGAVVKAGGPHPFNGLAAGTRSSVDLGTGAEMDVYAAASGVAHVFSSGGFTNCWVAIDHADGWRTTYYHLKNVDTGINGRTVAAGQRVGSAGQPGTETCGSGTANFRHVHFSLWRNGSEVAIDGTSIGGYTVHQTGDAYCGYWTRDSDGAIVADARATCYATPSLTNNQAPPAPPDGGGKKVKGDVNGDGKADMLWYERWNNHGITAMISNGSAITNAGQWLKGFGAPDWAAVGDFNGDGKADVAWYEAWNNHGITVALSTGTGYTTVGQWVNRPGSGDCSFL